jgi:hypothetical protein
VIGALPDDEGTAQDTTAWAVPGLATTLRGALGTPVDEVGVAERTFEGRDVPLELCASTLKLY